MGNGSDQKVRIQYLNTDLLLESVDDLSELVGHFEAVDCHALYHSDDGWRAGFGFNHLPPGSTPAQTISALMDVIERLGEKHRAVWDACTSRKLDVGYACGSDPYSTNDIISSELLRRMADSGISLAITLYGLRLE